MKAAFQSQYVRRLEGRHVKRTSNKAELVEQLREDIRDTLAAQECDRAVGLWCGSTEVHGCRRRRAPERGGLPSGARAQRSGHHQLALYAWAHLEEGVPFANCSPNLAVDFPAALELAEARGIPVGGKDLKTGQTLMKTVVAPALRARALGVKGWFSTNILGNRDGMVLDDPESFRSKELTKRGVLDSILDAEAHPELYGELFHKVRIEYYPPRGDAKEGWDNIDLVGWMGYPMQLKFNFLCRDSILAAPLVLDLALLLDLAARSGLSGMQEWMGYFFKHPMAPEGARAENDLFRQLSTLEDTIRALGRA